jgi:cytoskeleton protein RodZ
MTNTFKKPVLDDSTDVLEISQPVSKQKIAEPDIPIVKALQEARIKNKKSLAEISQSLRISQDYLQAIESADLEALPERVYTLGFVRSYARYLEFDLNDTIQRFKSEVLGDVAHTNYSMPKPINGNALPNQSLIWLIIALLVGCAIAGLYYFNSNTPTVIEKSQVPEVIRQEIQAATSSENTVDFQAAPIETHELTPSELPSSAPVNLAPLGV